MNSLILYLLVFLGVFITGFIASKSKKPILKYISVLLSFAILLIFIGIRYKVGTDYMSYLDMYDEIRHVPWNKIPSLRLEILPAIIMKTVYSLNLDKHLIFAIFGFLQLYPIFKINKLYDYKYLHFSLLMFCTLFLPFSLNGMRQAVAMNFMALSFMYIINRKGPLCLPPLIFAILFHTSSILILPYIIAYVICDKIRRSFYAPSLIMSFVIACMILFGLNDMMANMDIDMYRYLLKNINTEEITIMGLVFQLPIVLLTLLPSKYLAGDKVAIKSLRGLVHGGMILDVAGTSALYLSRSAYYFTIFEIILLPMIVQEIKRREFRIIAKTGLITFLIAYFIVQFYIWGRHDIFPYQTWVGV